MRLLLDTHALAWWANDASELSKTARAAIEDRSNQTFVSAISIFEAAQKQQSGKWPEAELLLHDVHGYLELQKFTPLPLSISHAEAAANLPKIHRDPFDRMLIAQAMTDELTIVSNEELFDRYGVNRLW